MIEVTYDGNCFLEVRGHAGSGPKGKDLVCAAVTALVLTLGEHAENHSIHPGSARLSGGSREVYKAMARGFQLLAENFPQSVHYKCFGIEK